MVIPDFLFEISIDVSVFDDHFFAGSLHKETESPSQNPSNDNGLQVMFSSAMVGDSALCVGPQQWQQALDAQRAQGFGRLPQDFLGLGRHGRFLCALLLPYVKYLHGCCLKINVTQAYDPALGFGSSSALIAGLHGLLFKLIFKKKFIDSNGFFDDIFVGFMRQTLDLLQGKGSGYDVLVQAAAATFSAPENSLRLFEEEFNSVTLPCLFIVDVLSKRVFKHNKFQVFSEEDVTLKKHEQPFCFLRTEVYSDTTQVLNSVVLSDDFYDEQKKMCHEFLQATGPETVSSLCLRSQNLMQKVGLLPSFQATAPGHDPLADLCRDLGAAGIVYKSMGAGAGDCLFVLAPGFSRRNAGPVPPSPVAWRGWLRWY